MRLDKILSNLNYGSRKEIKEMVKKKLIMINGVIINDSDIKVDLKYDKISINGNEIFYKEEIILAFHKPIGYLSANKDNMHKVLFELIKEPFNRFELKIAGRLDLDSEGLMILTTNGDLVHKLTTPKHHVDKIYEATLDKDFNDDSLKQLLEGVTLIDTDKTEFFAVAKELTYNKNICKITIDEGKFHQVKKMFRSQGFEVTRLVRKQIGKLKLDLNPGEYKEISVNDIF